MQLFELQSNGKLLRVRKEDFGCIIFADGQSIEGNAITFEVLRILAEVKTLDKLLAALESTYQVTYEVLVRDLHDLFASMQALGWFPDIYQQLTERSKAIS